jgi:glycosyltransferase involved in cell wall biosynthesis
MVSEVKKLTIVVASKNSGKYAADLIESLKRQSFQDFELLIIDSDSTDNTYELVNKYNKAKIINYKSGSEEAFNFGISLVKSKYIMLGTMTDYYPFNDWLDIGIKKLESNSELSMVWANAIGVDENGKFTSIWKPEYFIRKPMIRENFISHWLLNSYVPELNYIVKTDVYRDCISTFTTPYLTLLYRFMFNFTAKGYLCEYVNYIGHAGRIHKNQLSEIQPDYHRKDEIRIKFLKIKFFIHFIFERNFFYKRSDGTHYIKASLKNKIIILIKLIKNIINIKYL